MQQEDGTLVPRTMGTPQGGVAPLIQLPSSSRCRIAHCRRDSHVESYPSRVDSILRPFLQIGPVYGLSPRVCRFVTTQLRLKVNVSKSAMARPEERKFLGFRITNDGRQRQIAPQALNRFKMRIRELTRRTLSVSLPQLVEQLAPYLVGWRGYFGFCDAPRMLANLDAWIRRRLRMYLWRQWQSGRHTASRNCGDEASPSSTQQSPQGHRPGSGGCPATRPSSKPCAIAISTRSDFRDSLRLPMHNPIEPPWYVTRRPGGVTGKAREGLPMSINYRQHE